MLSENIKSLRKQKGYSQETLAQELNVVRQTVSKWEKGYSVPDALMLERLAELFEVSVGELLGEGTEKNTEPQSDLAQISAQLAILNEQYARELARKQKLRKIAKAALIPVLVLFLGSIIGIFISTGILFNCFGAEPFGYGDVSSVTTREVSSELYTQEDIASASDAVKEYFHEGFEGCTLNEIYYAGDERSLAESKYHEGETLVLLSSFYVDSSGGDGSFAADSTYDGWSWILVRESDGEWQVVNYGYA